MNGQDTKTAILNAAQDLIQRLGVNAVSYQQISDAVGIRKASIHHHFATKEDLIEALVERYSSYFLTLVDEVVVSSKSAQSKLESYIGLFEATLREGNGKKACLCAMLGAEVETIGAKSAYQVARFLRENEIRLTSILNQGLQDASFKFQGEATNVARMIFVMLEGALLMSRAQNGEDYFAGVKDGLFKLLK